jgi:hypothetical protein
LNWKILALLLMMRKITQLQKCGKKYLYCSKLWRQICVFVAQW